MNIIEMLAHLFMAAFQSPNTPDYVIELVLSSS